MTAETPIKPLAESELEFQGKTIRIVALADPIQYVVVASFCPVRWTRYSSGFGITICTSCIASVFSLVLSPEAVSVCCISVREIQPVLSLSTRTLNQSVRRLITCNVWPRSMTKNTG